ncbi:MAG TPA: fused MFS/spermidine synthase [Denitromonas sp.]|uniref:fused MFS/spermidine synthase n=1 Tax=Denitromonas sp. TaxID=2734609 RepID=UPI001DF439F8|nr:fused MFS/spermidine synthase [Rhodocyclaceae bacterium]MCP5220635.1 fused MFS/spermidine synthase [Zoogloeaceae bacterium]HPR06819.1 fused MFS/spermidine synthase [Denitromonas sp.]HQU87052.1 fused MFS/spermidine synthase [Denitromonas sp.]HQV14127.1 fused MFS/spermidine synthase [Denitromonas sp.]
MENPIDIREEAGVRFLHFGTEWVQGAMRLRTPHALELPYTREMMAGLLMREAPWPRRVLSIGLGAGSLAKFIHRQLPDAQHTVVEIEPRVLAIARQYFRFPADDERLQVHLEDGLVFMAQTDERWDLILLDAYDHDVRQGPLSSIEFYQCLRDHLTDDGLLSVNLFNRGRRYEGTVARLEYAFDQRALAFNSADHGNMIAFGAAGHPIELDATELRERALAVQTATGLDLRPTVNRLLGAKADSGELLRL